MKAKLTIIFSVFIFVILLAVFMDNPKTRNIKPVSEEDLISKTGACPPFFLLDEAGNMINPVAGINADKPYSPKQTCGKCHDYEKITRIFIFNREKMNLRVKFYEAVYSGWKKRKH